MKSIQIKFTLATIFLVSVVSFSIVRVWPYVVNKRSSGRSSQVEQLTKVVVNSVEPQYEIEMGAEEVIDLTDRIRRKVNASLLELPSNTRPSDGDSSAISLSFANFVTIHRAGSRLEYLENYPHERPPSALINDDTVYADQTWSHSTAWARHNDIDIDSIRVTPHFIRGQEIEYLGPKGTAYGRMLRTGKYLAIDGAGQFSAYKVYLKVTVPSYDGKELFDLELGIMMINDGPNDEWSPVSCEYLEVPMGTFIYTPRP